MAKKKKDRVEKLKEKQEKQLHEYTRNAGSERVRSQNAVMLH